MSLFKSYIFIFLYFTFTTCTFTPLDDSNYQNEINSHDVALVSVQGNTCTRCIEVITHMKKADQIFKQLNLNVLLGPIDPTNPKTKETVSQLTIDGEPSLFIIRNNNTTPYHALPYANSIVTFLYKLLVPTTRNLTSYEEVEQFINPEYQYMSIVVFNLTHESNYKYVNSMNKFCDFGFCVEGTDGCAKYFGEDKFKTYDYVVVKNFEDANDRFMYMNFSSEDDLIRIMIGHSLPMATVFYDFGMEVTYKQKMTALFLIIKHTIHDKEDIELFKTVMNSYDKMKYKAFILDVNSVNDKETLNFYGFDKKELQSNKNQIFMLNFKLKLKGQIIQMSINEDINEENLRKFITDAEKNKLTYVPRTEGEPETHPAKNLKTIVGKTFNKEIIENTNQNVLIAYVTLNNNCLECDELFSILKELAVKFEKKDDILFAVFDPVYNDVSTLPETITSKDLPIIEYYGLDKSVGSIRYKGKIEYNEIAHFVENEGFDEPVVVGDEDEEEENNGDNNTKETSDL